MWPKDQEQGEHSGSIRPTLPEQIANAYAERERHAAIAASIDAEEERRAAEKRKAAAEAETEELARVRLTEWLEAGGTEADFRAQWPAMMAAHFNSKHAVEDAERAALIDAQRVF